MLILFRVIQGAGGGGLQPMAQAILADMFPPQKRGIAFALYGITAIMAPTIGPTLGGWITDNYSWRWIFFINLPVGILALFLVMRLVEDPPFLRRIEEARASASITSASRCSRWAWARFRCCSTRARKTIGSAPGLSPTCVIVSAVCLIALVIWEWRHKDAHHRRAAVQEF